MEEETTKRAVWNKGITKTDWSPDVLRLDATGHPIAYSDYGNRGSIFGWEIDHIKPKKDGGRMTSVFSTTTKSRNHSVGRVQAEA